MVFSGMVACATDVRFPFPIFLLFHNPHHTDDAPDLEVLLAGITALGTPGVAQGSEKGILSFKQKLHSHKEWNILQKKIQS